MLEIFALIFLCQYNSKSQKARGRSGGAAVAYTLGLWLGLEVVGAFVGAFVFGAEIAAYAFALLFAIIGGVVSLLISRRGPILQPTGMPYVNASTGQQTYYVPGQQQPVLGQQPMYYAPPAMPPAPGPSTQQSSYATPPQQTYSTPVQQPYQSQPYQQQAPYSVPAQQTYYAPPTAPAAPAVPQESPAFCSSCGTPIKEGWAFCLMCGKQII